MPRWGLTADMRAVKPWGLTKDLLQTKKVITDPVHGDIFVTELERRVIDSPGFQRLRRVRQLGNTHLVYPGATHTRFAHSLGSLCVAQDLMDAVISQELGPHPKTDDLFAEWKEEQRSYVKRLAEATVLARLGGLLHDFTHVAFGHTIEDDLDLLTSHDENVDRYKHYWGLLPPDVREALERDELGQFLRPLILGKFQHTSVTTASGRTQRWSRTWVARARELSSTGSSRTSLATRFAQTFSTTCGETASSQGFLSPSASATWRTSTSRRLHAIGSTRREWFSGFNGMAGSERMW